MATIIVVGPNLASRQELGLALEELGHTVSVANRGTQAFELAVTTKPDLIIVTGLDVDDLSAVQLVRALRAVDSPVPVILHCRFIGWVPAESALFKTFAARVDQDRPRDEILAAVARILAKTPTA